LPDDPDLAQFVREHVRSVWALELLLALMADSARCWTPAELVGELRASASLVSDDLTRFERSGLALRDDAGCWRYAPASPLLEDLAGRLATAYRERPVKVINFIAAPPDPVQGLADAFRFRGDK